MITVKTKKILDTIPYRMNMENEYALVEDDKKMYQYKEGKWEPVKFDGGEFSITLADLNASIFAQLAPMTDEQLRNAQSAIYRMLGATLDADQPERNYWALICWDRRYITIFHHDDYSNEELSDIFMEVIENLGEIKDITINEDTWTAEIWITNDEGTYCYVFFDYKQGIIDGVA